MRMFSSGRQGLTILLGPARRWEQWEQHVKENTKIRWKLRTKEKLEGTYVNINGKSKDVGGRRDVLMEGMFLETFDGRAGSEGGTSAGGKETTIVRQINSPKKGKAKQNRWSQSVWSQDRKFTQRLSDSKNKTGISHYLLSLVLSLERSLK